MHAHLEEVLPLLENSRAVLRSAVDQVPEGRRRTRPAPDSWSVAEILEHLVKVNLFFAERITAAIEEARAAGLGPEHQPRDPLPHEITLKMQDRRERRQAREAVMPDGNVDANAAWADLDRAREDVRAAALRGDGLALGAVKAEHRFFGSLSVYQWIELTAAHECRHADQIIEIGMSLGH